ncbi:MAG TPA: RNA polymerase sigma factor region1.1 domain-containing protein [Acidimicrobiales bacterium]|nr:RNA polymerase sigma factor region1.1 domain-containing protein [Acidimicrobiales bacterium]
MSQSSDALTPPVGVSEAEFNRLLAQGRARRALSVDDVMSVLEHVELSEDVIDGVRQRLSAEGIELDEGEVDLNGADLTPPEEPVGTAAFAVPRPAPAPAATPDAPFLPSAPIPPPAGGWERRAERGHRGWPQGPAPAGARRRRPCRRAPPAGSGRRR